MNKIVTTVCIILSAVCMYISGFFHGRQNYANNR